MKPLRRVSIYNTNNTPMENADYEGLKLPLQPQIKRKYSKHPPSASNNAGEYFRFGREGGGGGPKNFENFR